MAKTVILTTDNRISVVDVPWNSKGWYAAIGGGCDIAETVKTQRMFDLFKMPILMIVDEERIRRDQDLNLAASILYGMDQHGCFIHGNVIFGIPEGPETLPPADPEAIKAVLMNSFPYLKEV